MYVVMQAVLELPSCSLCPFRYVCPLAMVYHFLDIESLSSQVLVSDPDIRQGYCLYISIHRMKSHSNNEDLLSIRMKMKLKLSGDAPRLSFAWRISTMPSTTCTACQP